MASGQASHTPVLTAAGAPNVALGLQVRSTPEYFRVPREYPVSTPEYPRVPRRIPRTQTNADTGGVATVRALQRAAL